MNITCAILHNDQRIVGKIRDFIGKTSFLTLNSYFQNPMEALTNYYGCKIQLYFVGIENPIMSGLQFGQLLTSPTRIIFISEGKEHAAECFRLDALDYLLSSSDYPVFLEAVNRALRWFNNPYVNLSLPQQMEEDNTARFIYIKSEYRIMQLELDHINYVEGLGDYIKIYCKDRPKPILSLCSMKSMEEKLPSESFIRVHRSYIVRKESIRMLERGNIVFSTTSIPIGDSYRKRFQEYLAAIPLL